MLDPASQRAAGRASAAAPCQLAIVIGDGLSPAAVNAHAVELVRNLVPRLADDGIEIGRAVVASGARVALGDEIGAHSRRAHGGDVDRRAAGPVGARQPRRLSDLCAAGSASPMPSAIASPTSTAPGWATMKPPSRSRGWFARVWRGEVTGVALKDESGDRIAASDRRAIRPSVTNQRLNADFRHLRADLPRRARLPRCGADL